MLALVLAASLTASDVPTPSVLDRSDDVKLLFLSERLHAGHTAAKVWYWSWTAIYAAGTVGQMLGFMLSTDFETQVNFAVGAATTALALLLQLIPGFPPESAPRELDGMPDATPEQRRLKLKRAEELMEESADAELFGRSWVLHVASAAVSIAGGLILWLGYGWFVDGLLNAVGGIAVTELQIWTQPMRATRDWDEYRARFLAPQAHTTRPSIRILPMVGGLAVAGSF